MSKKKTPIDSSSWRDKVPDGYELGLLGNGAWVPMYHGMIIEGDAYHGFFMKDAIDKCNEHARRHGLDGTL
jgi:hypothetical protein